MRPVEPGVVCALCALRAIAREIDAETVVDPRDVNLLVSHVRHAARSDAGRDALLTVLRARRQYIQDELVRIDRTVALIEVQGGVV